MQPALVVVADVLRECATQRDLSGEDHAARELGLQGVKEGFGSRVVAGTAHARALPKAMVRDEGTERGAHVLRAAIAVEDEPARWATTRESAGEDATCFPRRATTTEGPGEYAARMMVQYDGEIAPPVAEAEIRDVAHPHAINAMHAELPHAIGMLGKARANAGLGAISSHRFPAEPRRAHESRDAATTADPAGDYELPMESRTAVALLVLCKAANDFGGQRPVLDRVCAFAALPPRVEAARRDVVAAAERSDFEAFVLRDEMLDEGEDIALRALQNRMAFFRRSCSSLSSAYFRSRVCNCAISRAGPAGGAFRGWPRSRPSVTSFRHFESMKG